jgi:transposase
VNAIFYQNRTGCQWAYLPHDLPPKSATYYYFALWRDDGTDQTIHDLLRCQARERPAGPRTLPRSCWTRNPSAPPTTFQPRPPARTPGRRCRKRGLAVDALGLIIAVVVTAASVTDTVIGVRLLDKVVEHTPTVTRAWVDAGFKHDLAIHGAVLGVDVRWSNAATPAGSCRSRSGGWSSRSSAPRGALLYPRFSRDGLEGRFLGWLADLNPKGEGAKSTPDKPGGRVQMPGTARREDPRDQGGGKVGI